METLLYISNDPRRHMNDIQSTLKFNNDKVEEPEFYLGTKLSGKALNGKQVCTMLITEYINYDAKNI